MRLIGRKINRLPGFDYSKDGVYFITTCIKTSRALFGRIEDEELVLSLPGLIVESQWKWLQETYPYIVLDRYVVMPDHFHGIIIIDRSRLSRNRSRPVPTETNMKIKSISELVGAFKMRSSKYVHELVDKEFKWQRSFHDSILEDKASLNAARRYILNNPKNYTESG